MNSWIFNELNRREFLKKTALTGAAAYLGIGSDYSMAAVEPPPETMTVRFQELKSPCWVPQLVAEPLLREVLEAEPDNLPALDLLGFVLYFLDRPEEGEQACRRALELEPDHAYAHKGLGLNLAKRGGDLEAALGHIRRAMALTSAFACARVTPSRSRATPE